LGKFHLDGIPPMPRGVPQIEVTFDIDANGILNVSATEKSTGKENKITITNDKGRLSQDEIERMVAEAEKYKAEDDANRNRIESKNALENYCYSLKTSVGSDEVKGKLTPEDEQALEAAIDDTIKWLEANPTAEKEEYEEKMKELQSTVGPIMTKLHQAGGMPGGMPGAGGDEEGGDHDDSHGGKPAGPKIEDLD
jgi:L1 cell adhesion molecule like protein